MSSSPPPVIRRIRAFGTIAVGAVAAMVLAAGCSDSGSSSSSNGLTKSEIVIGNAGTYSGPSGVANEQMPAFYKAWAEWKNSKGGLNGHPVKFVTLDDKSDAATGTAAIRNLVENQKVLALVGTAEAGLETSWADYVTQKKVPVVGGYSYTPVWNTNPNFFPSGATLRAAVASGSSAAKLQGKKTYGVINCSEQSACAEAIKLHEASAKAEGLAVGYTGTAPVTSVNYTASCLAAKKAGVDALSVGLGGPAISRLATDCARQSYHPTYIFNATSVTPALLGNRSLDGAIVPLATFPWFVNDPQTAGFREVIKKMGLKDNEVGPALSAAFASAELFAKAAANVSDTPTADEIRTGLYAMKGETLGGIVPPLTFTQGAATRSVDCYFLAEIKGGAMAAPQGLKTTCLAG